jgi:hypothetical protein
VRKKSPKFWYRTLGGYEVSDALWLWKEFVLTPILSPAVVNCDGVATSPSFCIWNPETGIVRRIRGTSKNTASCQM